MAGDIIHRPHVRRPSTHGRRRLDTLAKGAQRLGIRLSARQIEQYHIYHRELEAWNERTNLTTVTGLDAVQSRHFLDSLTVAPAASSALAGAPKIMDAGTGAGFPGVPLKIVFPSIRLTLVDAASKRTAFLRHLVEKLELQPTNVITGRLEETGQDPTIRETFDLVVSRAVAKLNVLAELTLPHCATGGTVVCQKGERIEDELAGAEAAVEALGGEISDVVDVDLPELGHRRTLVVLRKLRPTPDRYPRRPGIPAKRPIARIQG